VDSPEGRERVADLLESGPFPHYESHPDRPGLLVRIDANGTRTVGRFVIRSSSPLDGDGVVWVGPVEAKTSKGFSPTPPLPMLSVAVRFATSGCSRRSIAPGEAKHSLIPNWQRSPRLGSRSRHRDTALAARGSILYVTEYVPVNS
jgi:hypothetical protein